MLSTRIWILSAGIAPCSCLATNLFQFTPKLLDEVEIRTVQLIPPHIIGKPFFMHLVLFIVTLLCPPQDLMYIFVKISSQ